jgi:hypothetical protein
MCKATLLAAAVLTAGPGALMADEMLVRLTVTVREAGKDSLLPCRGWVEAGGRRCYEPEGEVCVPYGRDQSFSCEGEFTIEVPPGRVVVHVERGKEYVSVDRAVTISVGEPARLEIELERWVDMPAEGWYSADMHVHFGADDLRVLKQLARADDVHWLPAFTYWNDFHRDWPEWPHGSNVFADEQHLVTLDNEEIERIGGEPFHSVGALFIFGLDRPVYVPRHDHQYPCDAQLARIAKATTPDCVIDTDKPTWGENVVTMGLGLFDSVQVCHNHYHRNNDIPMCCGMAGAEIEDEQRQWGLDELFIRTNMIYYRWLNCGFKLAVSGGAAMGVMPVPLGYSRTYARPDGPLTKENYLAAIRAGRTFATSGPMLTLTVNDREPGDRIDWTSGTSEPLIVRARLRSIEPIDAIEIIHNGQVIGRMNESDRVPSPTLDATLEKPLHPTRSGWIAARAIYRAPTGRLRQAHTSPVYVTVDGKPTANGRDAEYMIRWIDRLLEVSEEPDRYQSADDRAEVQRLFREARAVYEGIARTASTTWGD